MDQNIQKQTDLAGKKKAEAKGEAASGGSEEGSGGGGSDERVAPSAKTADGTVSVAGAVGVNVVSVTTRAHVTNTHDANAYGSGNLSLSSAAHTDVSVKADSSTVDRSKPGVGIAAAVALNKVTSTNETYLGLGDHNADGGVKLEAKTLEVGSGESADTQNEYRAEAISGAGAEDVGVAGALAVNLVDRRTAAYIKDNATAETGGGSVTVSASDRSIDVAKALPSGDGTSGSDVGIGASVALNVVLSRTPQRSRPVG